MRAARRGLNAPQLQNRQRYSLACSGERRPALTQSIIFLAKLEEIIP
jgi:hypothetical protein